MEAPHANHIIIVCGHAIWAGGPSNGKDESEWVIEDWKKGETPTYMAHIKAGVKALSEDNRALLTFSGGPTASSTILSEARSYANIAAANNYWGLLAVPPASSANPIPPHSLLSLSLYPRVTCEERALDSYQNILFSIIQFWRSTRRWPAYLTIISHAFKRRRLARVHCNAIEFPLERVHFVGINPPGVPEVVLSEEHAVDEWEGDPHGQSDSLKAKRARRNKWGASQTLFLTDDERRRSGVATKLLGGGEEVLVEGGARPWGQE